jgi:hypothetical protein
VKRRVFTVFSALSLLLLAAVVGLWVRSHYVADTVQWRQVILDSTGVQFNDFFVRTIKGRLTVFRHSSPPVPFNRPVSQAEGDVFGEQAGFWHWRNDPEHFRSYGERGVPLWAFIPPCLLILALRRRRLRSEVMDARGEKCQECGYDLRATPGRCPECGCVTGGTTG